MNPASPALAIPEGWIIDSPVRDRLHRQLARADPAWTGVVAEWGTLPAGSSYRVCAERRAHTPDWLVRPFEGLSVKGAAVVRPGVEFEVGPDVVTVEAGALLIDPGTVVHDPWHPFGALNHASPLGRPLGGRPVALFLGFERDPYLADWVRGLVNGLVRRGVEGRIAVPEPTAGLHLTRPCAPAQLSMSVLNPGVVVALDDEAVELSGRWLERRACGLVRLTPDTTSAVTIEAVRVGRWRRLEASIARGIGQNAMADLVRRLDRQHEHIR
jgi:hypothetical protein